MTTKPSQEEITVDIYTIKVFQQIKQHGKEKRKEKKEKKQQSFVYIFHELSMSRLKWVSWILVRETHQ